MTVTDRFPHLSVPFIFPTVWSMHRMIMLCIFDRLHFPHETNGAQPKDVQELLGHSDISVTMNVYAHADREAKRNSARLLDKVVGND